MTSTSMVMAAVAAQAEQVTKTYGDGDAQVRALDGLSLPIPSGRFTAIMGPSGSGKSTLLHCMAGLDTVTSGRVTIAGQDLAGLDDRRLTILRRERIGFVFQAYNLVPTLSARENIVLPYTLGGHRADPQWLDEVVAAVGMRDRLDHRPSELSGGQQQRVAVARAVITRPEIIFADEPTGNLDSKSSAEILQFMRQAVIDFGQTIVMVTHDPIAAAHAGRIVFLADGRIVDEMRDPTPDDVLGKMRQLGD